MKINTYDMTHGGNYQLQVVAEWLDLAGGSLTAYTQQDGQSPATVTIALNGTLQDVELPFIDGRWVGAYYNPLKAITEGILAGANLWADGNSTRFIWRIHQVGEARELANMMLNEGLALLQHMPRTGKTGTTLLALHHIQFLAGKRLRVLISTTTNGLRGRGWRRGSKPEGWQGFIEATHSAGFCTEVDMVLTTPYRLSKVDGFLPEGMTAPCQGQWDAVIVDESHKIYSNTDPKDTAMYLEMKMMCMGAIVVLVTATPHAQSLNQAYRQFNLAGQNSPFGKVFPAQEGCMHTKPLLTFMEYFSVYGEPKTMIIGGGRAVPVFSECKLDFTDSDLGTELVLPIIDHYRLSLSQNDVGIDDDMLPTDHKVVVELSDIEKEWIDGLRENGNLMVDGVLVQPLNDRHIEIMTHQIEGGTLKFKDEFSTLDAETGLKIRGLKAETYRWTVGGVPSKVAWMLGEFGDTKDLVIMYHYTNEGPMLRRYFRNATVLQGKTNSEAIDLYMFEHMVVYSTDWSVATYIQRRDRQVHMTKRTTPIKIHYPVSEGGVSEDVFDSVVTKGIDLTFDHYDKLRTIKGGIQ